MLMIQTMYKFKMSVTIGSHLMDYYERLVEPLILNNLVNDEQLDELSVVGGAIKILAKKLKHTIICLTKTDNCLILVIDETLVNQIK